MSDFLSSGQLAELKASIGALRQYANSPEGMALLNGLNERTRRDLKAAEKGDSMAIGRVIQQLSSTDQGRALMETVRKITKNGGR